MSGVSVSHLILFIASLVVAAAVAGTLVTEVDQVSTSVSESSDGVSEEIATDLEIISDTGSDAIYDEDAGDHGTVTVLVKNTGSVDLAADSGHVDVLLDGRYVQAENVTIERADDPEATAWETGTVVEIEIELDESIEGDTRTSVIANGNEETLEFRA